MHKIFTVIFFSICSIVVYAQFPSYNNTKLNHIKVYEPSQKTKDQAWVLDSLRTVDQVSQVAQYVDGMGRIIQTVNKGISPVINGIGKFDVVDHVLYNYNSKSEFKYLPYVSGTADGSFKKDPFAEQNEFMTTSFPGESVFYEQQIYEKSPLQRLMKTLPAGASWGGSSRGASSAYLVNTLADAVRIWEIDTTETSVPNSPAVYAAGTLQKHVKTDEQGNKVVDFTNFKNQIVLHKVALTGTADGHGGWLNTYYVYDVFGQLRFIIPPAATDAISGTWSFQNMQAIIDNLCFKNVYDNQKRLIIKKVPGAGEIEMVYDNRDRLVFQRDANLKAAGKWLINFYDVQNRQIMGGFYIPAKTRSELQTLLNKATGTKVITSKIADDKLHDLTVSKRDPSITLYTARNSITFSSGFETTANETFETSIDNNSGASIVTLTVSNPLPDINDADVIPFSYTYYDNYSWRGSKPFNAGLASYLAATAGSNADPLIQSNEILGFTTGTKVKVFISGGEQWLVTTTYYDEKGRIIQLLSDNINGGSYVNTNRYNFKGKTIGKYTYYNNPASSQYAEIKILTLPEYDHAGRVIAIKKQVNNEPLKTIVKQEYNKNSQLSKKILGDNLQELEYDYNIRGWLTGVNRKYLADNLKLYRFGYELAYDKTASLAAGTTYNSSYFNGNVSGMTWKGIADAVKRKFDYTYDPSDRLLKASYLQAAANQWSNTTADFTVTIGNGIDPNSAYDANGNIKHLLQKGLLNDAPATIDDLNYTYTTQYSNKLLHVRDAANRDGAKTMDFNEPAANNIGNLNSNLADYVYDLNGNITIDKNKNISKIIYNHLNLPEKIDVDGKGSVTFIYNALGTKLRKIVEDKSAGTSKIITTDYIGELIYQNDNLESIAHEEGRVRPIVKSGNFTSYAFDYFIKDYLNNTRLVLTDQKDLATYRATMESENSKVENLLFSNIEESKAALPPGYPGDGAKESNKFAAKLNARTKEHKIGPSLVLKVMPGDTISIGVKAFYKNTGIKKQDNPVNAEDMVAALLQAFHQEDGSLFSAHGAASGNGTPFNTNFYNNQYQQLRDRDADDTKTDKPRAYLNFALFDEHFKLVEENSGVRQVKNEPDQPQELATDKMVMNKSGLLYIYTSNESQNDVYFDNLVVLDAAGPVLEETHYYPFGLVMEGISGVALKGTNYAPVRTLYNSKELQHKEFSDGTGIQWYDYGSRMYDMQLGKWESIDSKSDKMPGYSPYVYAFNNPVKLIDHNGEFPMPPSTFVDQYGNVIGGTTHDNDRSVYMISGVSKFDINSIYQYKRDGTKIGETVSLYSFLTPEDGKWRGRVNFTLEAKADLAAATFTFGSFLKTTSFYNGFSPKGFSEYKNNAGNGAVYDIKSQGFDWANASAKERLDYAYQASYVDDKIIMTKRDIGNFFAGRASLMLGLKESVMHSGYGAFQGNGNKTGLLFYIKAALNQLDQFIMGEAINGSPLRGQYQFRPLWSDDIGSEDLQRAGYKQFSNK